LNYIRWWDQAYKDSWFTWNANDKNFNSHVYKLCCPY
jgi:hypothetical protein